MSDASYPGTLLQVIGFGGAMTWYALHLFAGMAVVPLACEIGSTWPVHLATAVALAGIVVSGVVASRVWRAGRRGGTPLQRRRWFLGSAGLMLSVLAFAIVVFADIPAHVLDPCLP